MSRARVGLLGAAMAAMAMLASGCGTEPSSAPSIPAPTENPAPTAPVGANGQPITNLCDLLTDQDFSTVLGVAAKAPATNDANATSASCVYGDKMTLTVKVLATTDEAANSIQDAVKNGPFTTKKNGPLGGVDESVYGTGKDSIGITVRREKLVITITAPGKPADGEIKLIQLAGLLLSRANALGT